MTTVEEFATAHIEGATLGADGKWHGACPVDAGHRLTIWSNDAGHAAYQCSGGCPWSQIRDVIKARGAATQSEHGVDTRSSSSTIEDFLAHFDNVKRTGRATWKAACPAHDDRNPSLSIKLDGDKILVKCFAGCETAAVLAVKGLAFKDLFLTPAGSTHGTAPRRKLQIVKTTEAKATNGGTPVARPTTDARVQPRIVKTYPYHDERDALGYESVRFDPKDFRPRRPDGDGNRVWGLKAGRYRRGADGDWRPLREGEPPRVNDREFPEARRIVYRLPDLAEQRRAFLCEGEKDADNVSALGLAATTTIGGAEAWRREYGQQIRDAGVEEIVCLPHNDKPGHGYMRQAAEDLCKVGVQVRMLTLPGLGPLLDNHGKDVSDWLEAGHTRAELLELAASAPIYSPCPGGATAPAMETTSTAPSPDAWPQPQPIKHPLAPVRAFDPKLLPKKLRDWAVDIAERVQCPLDFVAVGIVVAVATVIGRKITIRPKQKDDWTVVPNLWGMIVGRPGVLKSPALAEALRPLHRLVAAAQEQHKRDLAQHAATAIEIDCKREEIKKDLQKAVKGGSDTSAIKDRLAALQEEDPPTERRYMTSDSTVEKLGVLANENPNGLLVHRDEISGLLSSMDREGHEGDRAFYNEAWNGNGSFTYDRIGRGTVHIDALCLSILGSIQPGPLESYLVDAFGGGRDDGFVQRFQLAIYPDIGGEWRLVDRWPDTGAKQQAFEVFQRLDTLDATSIGADPGEDGGPAFLRFGHEAQQFFNDWLTKLEQRLRSGDEHDVLIGHLAKYRSLMPSLALIFHLVEGVPGAVSLHACQRAAAWCDYLEAHARRIYQTVTARDEALASTLADKISKGMLGTTFTLRDVMRKDWAGFRTAAETESVLDLLEEMDWLRSVERRPGRAGGRPSRQYLVNPRVLRR